MRTGSLLDLVAQSLRRHGRTYLLSAIGIVAGVCAFTFFVGLTQGVRAVVLFLSGPAGVPSRPRPQPPDATRAHRLRSRAH